MRINKGSGLSAFGDSFTVGSLATSNNGYAQQLAAYIAGTFANFGVGSSLTTRAARSALQYLPVGNRTANVSWMAGLNDIRGGGMAALPKIEGNLRSFLASCFLKEACPASAMTRVGSWANLPNNYGGKAYYIGGAPLNTNGSLTNSLSWSFEGDNLVVGAYRTNGVTSAYRDLSIVIDGGDPITFETIGNTNELITYDAKVIRGLGEGAHTVSIYPLSTAAHNVLDYVGTLEDSAPVLIAEIPYIQNWSQYGAIGSDAICEAANVVINNVVAEFCGFNVEIVKTNDFFDPFGAGQSASDGIHPTSLGHSKILEAFKDKINLVEYLTIPPGTTKIIINDEHEFTPPLTIEVIS
jgi:lysophospholipase L1-like esterase